MESLELLSPTATLEDLFWPLPPNPARNVYLSRTPNTALSVVGWHQLAKRFPLHLQRRRLRQLYSTEENGFSLATLKACCSTATRSCILLIRCGNGSVVGAYLSHPPVALSTRYFGSSETFVFSFNRGGELRQYCAVASGATSVTVPTNQYFIFFDENALAVGGGGKGPAIRIPADVTEVASSEACPTFAEYECLIPASGDDPQEKAAVCGEAGTFRSAILSMEVYEVTDDAIGCFHK